MDSFRKRLESGEFVITAEVTPPRSALLDSLLKKAGLLSQAVDAINVTDGAGANVRMSSISAAIALKQAGFEPIVQATCRDRNRIALQSDLLGAAALGVRNVLILGGDDVTAGDSPDAKPVFDLDSRSLLRALAGMRDRGVTLSGRPIEPRPDFVLGAADTCADPRAEGWSARALLAKVGAGAQFIQTQYCFDPVIVERHIYSLREAGLPDDVAYLVGIGPLRSARTVRWMREKLWGTVMPEAVIERMEAAEDAEETGIDICAEILARLREIPGVSGAHLMAPGHQVGIVEAVKRS